MRFCRQAPRQQAEYFNELQKIALTQTRLKIPVMEDEEGTHGAMFSGATVFPEGLAVGSSFDLDLVKSIYAAAAAEARAVGIHMLSTLVMEVDRDPRMGRNEEAYTEDPYLYMRIGETIVRATQGSDISAPDKVDRGADRFPHAKRTRQRPGARRHRGFGALPARKLSAALDRRHYQSRRSGRDGGLSGNRRRAGPRLGEVDERRFCARKSASKEWWRAKAAASGPCIYEHIVPTQKEAGVARP